MESLFNQTSGKPVGIFDSGLGGLTAVKAMKKFMPFENVIYFGDTGRVPYGNKGKNEIIKYAYQDINFLKSMDVKIIIAACGTVSSYLDGTENAVIGVIYPSCLASLKATKNSKIGVIGTNAAIGSESYKKCIINLNPGAEVYQQSCPKLVPLIESGITTDLNIDLQEAVKTYIKPLIDKNIDTLVLGCTHYAIIKDTIKKAVGENIAIIDSGEETVKFVKNILIDKKLGSLSSTPGGQEFFVSGEMRNFSKSGKTFLGHSIENNITKININNY